MIQLIQTSLLTYGVILPSPFFKTQRGADHQFWPSDKIELFCREDKNYLKRFFTYTCILFLYGWNFMLFKKLLIQRGGRRRGMRRTQISVPGPSLRCVRWRNTCSPSSTTWSRRASWTVYRWSAGVGRYSGAAPGNRSSSTCTTASWSDAGCRVLNEGLIDNSL